jgi:hypothetical protein
LDAVGTKIPVMITNILKTVYSEEAGRNVGRAVGTLYQELMNSGIPKETALKMATDYMISFKDLLGSLDLGKDRTRSPGAPTPGTTEDEA